MGAVHVSARSLLFTFVWILLCTSSIGQHCGHPGKPAFSEFHPSDAYEVGHRVSYECIDGYQLNSPFRNSSQFPNFGQRECLPNGTWSHDNVYCYRRLPAQTPRCIWKTDGYQFCSLMSDTVSDLLLITSLRRKSISGLNVESFVKRFEEAQSFNTSSALFRFPLDKITDSCRPLLNQVFVRTQDREEISVTPYARNNLCGIPETPANGKLIRVSDTAVQYVCNSDYRLEGNEYRHCIDSLWYGTQVICNKITDENGYDQFISSSHDQFHITATVAIALSALAVLSVFVMYFMMKRILRQRDHSNTDTHTSIMKNAKIVDTPVDAAPVYDEIKDKRVPASDHLYELPTQCSVTRPL